jgi:hypothetical protein
MDKYESCTNRVRIVYESSFFMYEKLLLNMSCDKYTYAVIFIKENHLI